MRWRVQDMGVLALLVALPLLSYPLGWLPPGWSQFRFSLRVNLTELSLAVLLIAACRAALRGTKITVPRVCVWPALMVALSWLISVRFSQHPHYSVRALPLFAGNLAIFFLAANFPEQKLRTLCWWWLVTALVVAVNGLARLGVEPVFVSTVGNRNFLGAFLAAAIPLALALRDRRAAGGCIVFAAALFFAGSRGAWLALAGAGIFLALVGRQGKRVALLIAVAVLVAVAGLAFRGYIAQQWQTDVRPMIWKATLAMSAARPVAGHGLGIFALEYPEFRVPEYFLRPKAANLTDHAHNELLEVAAEQGLFGLAATLWLWAAALCSGVRASRVVAAVPAAKDKDASGTEAPTARPLRLGLMGAALVFILHGMVDVDLRYPPNQTLLWVALGLLFSGRQGPMFSVALRSKPARALLAVVCAVAAAVVFWTSVLLPARADYWEREARLAEAAGHWSAAVSAARRSLEIEPMRLGTRYFLAGLLARDASTLAEAVNESLKIQELAPDYGDITFNLGQLYVAGGRPQEAVPALRRAVRINPFSADKRYVLALALAQSGQREAAVGELVEALRLDPQHGGAAGLLAELGGVAGR